MVTNGRPEDSAPDDFPNRQLTVDHGRRDTPRPKTDALRPDGDPDVDRGDALQSTASHRYCELPPANQANYSAPTASNPTAATTAGRGPQVLLPPDGPALTSGAARMLLRILQTAATPPQLPLDPPAPPARTP